MTPPTNLRIEIFDSASEPPQRSIAMLSAWRTRTSSKGLRVVLKTIIKLLTQVPSNTTEIVLHLVEQLGLFRRIAAAELGVELAADNAGNNAVRFHEEGLVAVEVGLALVEIVVKALALPARALARAQRT